MLSPSLVNPAVLARVIVIVSICCWEYFVRSNGFVIGYNEDETFWAKYRAILYEPSYKTTVFINSSRIKYDLDVDSRENITGEKAIQLGAK